MTWFEDAFEFDEGYDYNVTRGTFFKMYNAATNTLLIKGRNRMIGEWNLVSLMELRNETKEGDGGEVRFSPTTDEAKRMHQSEKAEGAMFQAASQFNCLEFPSQHTLPEHGITNYMYDRTQGPACAIACPFGTAFRNYLVQVNAKEATYGQQKYNQLNCLSDLEQLVAGKLELPEGTTPWTMQNGYIDATENQLKKVNALIKSNPATREELRQSIKIGVHYDTETQNGRLCGQCYCSATAVQYSKVNNSKLWEPLSRLILDATYEATLRTAIKYKKKRGNDVQTVYLTKVGGGVFGNEREWIAGAMRGALDSVAKEGHALDVQLVHFREVEPGYEWEWPPKL